MNLLTPHKETCRADKQLLGAGDVAAAEARMEIAGMLALAYRRLNAIRRVGSNEGEALVEKELANLPATSVHGGVE